ncbi:MAG: hypothetical protein DRP68_02285 [Candidatus Omnitrophota bacterium]|nr:MAG: hypothetical protein DRP68_02285 [Candidatus Omnitrophota bacterium]RKY45605.1 MAG: hypothetical protein DRP81_03365 [Candidatus Omnitrophota bacterium]
MMEKVEFKEKKIPLKGVVKYVYKRMGKAILDYNMIEKNDKILVAVSGGSDSLSLVKLLKMRKRRVPIDFQILACFVDTDFIKIDKKALLDYLERESIPFVVKKMELKNSNVSCFWCSWNRRKVLFQTAQEFHCNKVALGHHLDDIVETILMNLLFFGEVSAMKPKIELFEGRLTIIRPLCYIEKKDLINFANRLNLDYTNYRCSYGKDSRRELIKAIIKKTEESCPYVKKNIFNALKNIKTDYLI